MGEGVFNSAGLFHRSRVTGHGSQVTGHRSRVTGHGSQVTGHRFMSTSTPVMWSLSLQQGMYISDKDIRCDSFNFVSLNDVILFIVFSYLTYLVICTEIESYNCV